jgi:hypothetical protein
VVGSRVLWEQWYPVKVDNAYCRAVLDEYGELRAGVVEMLEKENEVGLRKYRGSAGRTCRRRTDL